MSAPIAPPTKPIIALCGKISAQALWLAGLLVKARVAGRSRQNNRRDQARIVVLTLPTRG